MELTCQPSFVSAAANFARLLHVHRSGDIGSRRRRVGQFQTGRRIDAAGRNINDVLLTIVKTMGLNTTTVGDAMFNKEPMSLT